jgi:hypothetical protein
VGLKKWAKARRLGAILWLAHILDDEPVSMQADRVPSASLQDFFGAAKKIEKISIFLSGHRRY